MIEKLTVMHRDRKILSQIEKRKEEAETRGQI